MRRASLIAHIELFGSLSDADREALAERLHERRFAAGDAIFRQGDAGTSMFIVLSGSVQISLPGDASGAPPLVLAHMRGGEYFGELALFDDKPRSATATAEIDTQLLELTRAELGAQLARSPTAAMTILQGMSTRVRETNALLSERAAKDADKEIEEKLTWADRFAERVAVWNGSWA
ncbi:MAG: cyclic nucleotide-binding domain-containing protein, partial [Polyangiales bacterium]